MSDRLATRACAKIKSRMTEQLRDEVIGKDLLADLEKKLALAFPDPVDRERVEQTGMV